MVHTDNYNSTVKRKIGVVEFHSIFSNDNECFDLVFNLKYNGRQCKKCRRFITENYIRSKRKDKNGVQRKSFRCKSCHTEIYPLADTALKNMSIKLSSIFYLLFWISISKKSISAVRVSETLSVCYKTAHKIMMLIRSEMREDIGALKGTIEIDEVFIGKGSKVYNWSSISTRKQPLIGMIERETKKVKVFLVEDRSSKTIRDLVQKNVECGSTIYTDSWLGYTGLYGYYKHESVDHTKREFVRGEVHTNNIEGLWRRLKTSIRGAHIKITAKYVQMYVNELCWRENHKEQSPMERFDVLLRRIFSIPAR